MLRKSSFLIFLSFLPAIKLLAKDDFLLPEGKNRDLLLQNCISCHSEKIIIQNHLSRKSWDEKITWMQKSQNLWELSADVRSKILDYLEAVQGPLSDARSKDPLDGLFPRNANLLIIESN